jgi:hypothetical protein
MRYAISVVPALAIEHVPPSAMQPRVGRTQDHCQEIAADIAERRKRVADNELGLSAGSVASTAPAMARRRLAMS